MYKIQTRVWPGSTSEDGLLSLRAAVSTMMDCSQMWLSSEPVMWRYLDDHNSRLIVVGRQLDVVRLPECGEPLEVIASGHSSTKLIGTLNTNIYDAQGEPCFLSWCKGAFMSLDTGKPIQLSQEVLDSLDYSPQHEMEFVGRKVHVPELNRQEYPHFLVPRSDIDFNKHANNAQYVRMACDLLPIERSYNRLRIEYRLPSRCGDEIAPFVTEVPADDNNEQATYVELCTPEGKAHAIMEFSRPVATAEN